MLPETAQKKAIAAAQAAVLLAQQAITESTQENMRLLWIESAKELTKCYRILFGE